MNKAIKLPGKVKKIIGTLTDAGHEAYAVGGCVRDALLGRAPGDWDITTKATPEEVKSLFRRTFDSGLKHGTVTVMLGEEGFEVTTYRIDGIYEDGRHPASVTYTASLEEDLKRRDFSINAMAYNDKDGLVDLHGGVADLEKKAIRCVGEAKERFAEDGLRLMRAVRFSAELGFQIEEKTKKAMADNAENLQGVSAERIMAELVKLVVSPNPDYLRIAYETGLTKRFFPEFDLCMETPQNNPHHCHSVGEHILHSMKNIAPEKELRLAMMLHDIGKPLTHSVNKKTGNDRFHGHPEESARMAREIMRRLKFDNKTTEIVCRLVRHHDYVLEVDPDMDPRDFQISERFVRRAIMTVGEDVFPLYLQVQAADIAAQSEHLRSHKVAALAKMGQVFSEVMATRPCVKVADLAINGNDLIGIGVPKGKMIGGILSALLEDVVEFPEHNEREYLLAMAEKMRKER